MVLVAAVAGRPATASIGQRRSAATAAEEPGQGCTTTNAQPAEGNVYASKSELLEWVNGLLQLQLSTWGAFASGAVFCQLLDAYFSDAIPMHKVDTKAGGHLKAPSRPSPASCLEHMHACYSCVLVAVPQTWRTHN